MYGQVDIIGPERVAAVRTRLVTFSLCPLKTGFTGIGRLLPICILSNG